MALFVVESYFMQLHTMLQGFFALQNACLFLKSIDLTLSNATHDSSLKHSAFVVANGCLH